MLSRHRIRQTAALKTNFAAIGFAYSRPFYFR